MEKNLRKVALELNRWLQQIDQAALNLQKDLLRLRENKQYDKVLINNTSALITSLRKKIRAESGPLSLLQSSPPGFLSSIIDFMYNVTVDPRATSQKEMYYQKLENLGKSVEFKKYRSLASALEETNEAFAEKLYRNDPDKGKKVADFNEAAQPVQDLIFDEELDVVKAKMYVGPLLESLTSSDFDRYLAYLGQAIPLRADIDKKTLEKRIAILQKAKSELLARATLEKVFLKYATADQIIQKHFKVFEQLGDGREYLERIDNLANQAAEKKSSQLELFQRYDNYVQSLLDTSRSDSIPTYLNEVKKQLISLGAQEESQPKELSSTQVQPKETKTIEQNPPIQELDIGLSDQK